MGETAREEEERKAESAVQEFAAALGMRARLITVKAGAIKCVSIECPGAGKILAGTVDAADAAESSIPWTCALADLDGRERPGMKPGIWARPSGYEWVHPACYEGPAAAYSRLVDIVCSRRPMQAKIIEAVAAGLVFSES